VRCRPSPGPDERLAVKRVRGASGTTGLAHGAAHLAGKVGAKGLFGKATGLKLGGGLVATAVAATTVYLVWPAPQHVGGTTSGSLHMYLNQPGKVVPYRAVNLGKPDNRYDPTRCAYLTTTTSTYTVTVPKESALKHGAYLLSPIGRPRITYIEIGPKRNTFFNPENAGAQAEGSLPRITVLP
jgi:hypothetical protein